MYKDYITVNGCCSYTVEKKFDLIVHVVVLKREFFLILKSNYFLCVLVCAKLFSSKFFEKNYYRFVFLLKKKEAK